MQCEDVNIAIPYAGTEIYNAVVPLLKICYVQALNWLADYTT